jgi:nitroreductase
MQFCLAATAQGLSTCILGSINRKKLKELPEIGEDVFVLIAVGYAADSPLRRKQRKGLDEILKFAE